MNHIKTPIMSLSFREMTILFLNRAEEMKKHGYRIWYNSLWDTFNGGHDDEMALDNPDGSYGWLLQTKEQTSSSAITHSYCWII